MSGDVEMGYSERAPLGFDFHLHKSRKPRRCHRIKVSGFTTIRARRHAKSLESHTRGRAGGITYLGEA